MEENNRYKIEILDLSLDVIDYLVSMKGEDCSSSDVAKALNINRSRAYRILRTLEVRGYVMSSMLEDGYGLGPKFIQIGMQIRNHKDIRLVARQVLEQLAAETGETTNLSLRRGDKALLVDTRRGHHRVQIEDPIGALYPLHSGAGTKVLLAYLPEQDREKIIDLMELPRFTQNTITDRKLFQQVLDKVVENGYGIDNQEHDDGVWGVGAPICDPAGQVFATVSVFIPYSFYDDTGRQKIIDAVVTAGHRISSLLGCED